ncbi:mandelate racemase/muconate lactonizing enzyme family protein [Fusibacter paucivorans]|uniref:Mandelate racemase/muconate lactonizing enzyme family protein n=1 Tax=Fusibacter paucivorans TaxID=76009 RepID=A0ABS5PVJ5_9FIRM|nr:mandelate racemase/muconate lactonizing enzyme family protein [Fusibacter paucivorans]MBS7528182.1 mandelate racemase/muconate lactonizing enzyme family protein [Fusibacter paucivorans]
MKITQVDMMLFDCHLPFPYNPIGCRIYTDEGIYGDGEAALSYGVGSSAAAGMIKDLARLIIGMDPLDNEVIWDKLHKTTFWGQNGGPVVFSGISAIDSALWDIKGKSFNVPIYKLLGGKKRDSLRCYASQIQSGFGPKHEKKVTPDDYAAIAKQVVREGYDAVKVDFLCYDEIGNMIGQDRRLCKMDNATLSLAMDRLIATREAVGSKVDIIIENHSNLDALSAVQFAQAAEKYNIFYFEEPNTPSPKTCKYISENTSIPIANGERIFSRWQYAPYFENMSLQIAQPDIGTCGGVTEAKKICDMAHAYDVAIQAHVCGSPLSLALSLHLEAAIPNFIIHEHHLCFLHQYNKDLCLYDYQPINGSISIPDKPGIGNEWSEKALSEATTFTVK